MCRRWITHESNKEGGIRENSHGVCRKLCDSDGFCFEVTALVHLSSLNSSVSNPDNCTEMHKLRFMLLKTVINNYNSYIYMVLTTVAHNDLMLNKYVFIISVINNLQQIPRAHIYHYMGIKSPIYIKICQNEPCPQSP